MAAANVLNVGAQLAADRRPPRRAGARRRGRGARHHARPPRDGRRACSSGCCGCPSSRRWRGAAAALGPGRLGGGRRDAPDRLRRRRRLLLRDRRLRDASPRPRACSAPPPLAAYTILHNIEALVFMIALGLSVATAVRVGQAAGAGDARRGALRRPRRARRRDGARRRCSASCCSPSRRPSSASTAPTRGSIARAAPIIAILAVSMVFDAGQVVLGQSTRALGDSWGTTALLLRRLLLRDGPARPRSSPSRRRSPRPGSSSPPPSAAPPPSALLGARFLQLARGVCNGAGAPVLQLPGLAAAGARCSASPARCPTARGSPSPPASPRAAVAAGARPAPPRRGQPAARSSPRCRAERAPAHPRGRWPTPSAAP